MVTAPLGMNFPPTERKNQLQVLIDLKMKPGPERKHSVRASALHVANMKELGSIPRTHIVQGLISEYKARSDS